VELDALDGAVGRNLHERIADTIARRIVAGAHPAGSSLPTELDMCESLSVSRSAVREAFKLLSARRLIVSRRKLGTKVRPRAEWNMLDPEVLAWNLRGAPTDAFVTGLFEVREIVEPAAAALAAARRTEAGAAALDAALADMVRFQGHRDDLIRADIRFHQAILDASGNPFLASFGAVIESALAASFQLSWGAMGRTPDEALQQHRDIAHAIRDASAGEARTIMTRLLRSAIDDVRASLVRRHADRAAMEAPPAA
jgi:DNA-binding FadR family transcriptional regulator